MINLKTILCTFGLHDWSDWCFTISDVTDKVRICHHCEARQYISSESNIRYTEKGADAQDEELL